MSKNVSTNFKNVIKNGGPFYSYAVITLSDGTKIDLTSDYDFLDSDNEYSEGSESGFPIGAAISKVITLNLDNTVDVVPLKDTDSENILDSHGNQILISKRSQNYDYYYARIALYTEVDLPDGTVERIQEGIFTVIDSVSPGDVLEITAYDDMYKADVEFKSTLTYPVSAQMLLNEVCSKCDIALGSASFKNNDFVIQNPPSGLTGRQVIGYIAQIACGNAVIDHTGHLVIKSYDFSGFDVTESVTPGDVETESGIHIISEFTTVPDIGTDYVKITGVSTTIESDDSEDDEIYLVGSEEYAISIDNPLISGHEKEAVDLIAESIIGITVRPFNGDFFPDPTVEFMDLAYVVDRKNISYKTFITSHDFKYMGSSTFACGVESPERHGGSYYSTAGEVYQKSKEEIIKNKTQWEQAIEQLSQQVENASGLYTTEEVQPDGSMIFYMHNKPLLEESDMVWKMTAETITVSTDGGQNWNAGITVNGEVIAKIMYTIGINFDWGVGGTLIIQDKDGNQTAYIDAETGTVRLSVESLRITGKTVDEIAEEVAGNTVDDFVNGQYSDTINDLYESINQKANTYYQDTDPSLDWTETEEFPLYDVNGIPILDSAGNTIICIFDKEKAQHEGDIWKNSITNDEYIYQNDQWVRMPVPDIVFDEIDGKSTIFTVQPAPPYHVGDSWFTGTDILVCETERLSGDFVSSDWKKKDNYTDDTYAEQVELALEQMGEDLQNQIDGKIQTYNQSNDPSSNWTDQEKSQHIGDLWYNSSAKVTKRWSGSSWQDIENAEAENAAALAKTKAKVFTETPSPPYEKGDLWITSLTGNGIIKTCETSRETGNYTASDWVEGLKYTDDSAVDELDKSLGFEGIFNRLTNNGAVQGMYIENGQIYFLFTYAKGGELTIGNVNNESGVLKVVDESGNEIGSWDASGFYTNGKYFAVTKDSRVYSNNPVFAGSLYMCGNLNGTLVDNAERTKAAIMSLAYQTSSGEETGNYSMYFAQNNSGSGNWIIKSIRIGARWQDTSRRLDDVTIAADKIVANGDFSVTGEKNRVVQTKNYGDRKLSCYEMTSPVFGDIGEGKTDENGECVISISDVFSETVNTGIEYQVFLQKEGNGDVWIDKKEHDYFVVKGTPNLKFSWEIKAKQQNYEYNRMEIYQDLDTPTSAERYLETYIFEEMEAQLL